MNFNIYIYPIPTNLHLNQTLEKELWSRMREIEINKGTYLLHPGEVCKYLYIVKSGFFRVYTSDGFDETTTDFAGQGQIAVALHNFLVQKSAQEGIVCEADAIVYRLSYHDWMALQDLAPEFISLSNLILQKYLLLLHTQKDKYRTSNSAQKYQYLTQQYKGIANIVSQKHIASYLGITGPTLSTLLKDMLRKT